jgi:hypothetical protein
MAIEQAQTAVPADAALTASDEPWGLENQARARPFGDWMFEQFPGFAGGKMG